MFTLKFFTLQFLDYTFTFTETSPWLIGDMCLNKALTRSLARSLTHSLTHKTFSDSKIFGYNVPDSTENLRRRNQTGTFLLRIRPPLCQRQNESGTKTFRIRHESGKISVL